MLSDTLRIGCWAGFWGDSAHAAAQVLRDGAVDVLIADHLAEITMALLARAKQRNPEGGYVTDAVDALTPLLDEICRRGTKVVTNAGGLNPRACAEALADAGTGVRVAYVTGDDLSGRYAAIRAAGGVDMFNGEALPERALTMNAYLGARPIVEAFRRGADVVVTGRCADSALALAPLIHAFGWTFDDFDRLSAGSLIGHLLECGPQTTGGLSTDWETVDDWENIGYPLADCAADGTAIITKPDGTGGRVDRAAVAEQLVYEIGDPGNYVLPDVACDWTHVTLEEVGPQRVRVAGAKGHPPTGQLKATTTIADGYRVMTTATFAGGDAVGRARRAGQTALNRAERLLIDGGREPFTERDVEVVGGGDLTGQASHAVGREAVVKIAARHPDRTALEVLAQQVAPLALVAQGMTGLTAGRPRPAPCIRLMHVLVPASSIDAAVHFSHSSQTVDITAPITAPAVASEQHRPGPDANVRDLTTVPLRRIAVARSGDKGNDANIGVIARSPHVVQALRDGLDADALRAAFGHLDYREARTWDLPGIGAINILLVDALGGGGGTSSLRLDPQGKTFAAILLDRPIAVSTHALEAAGL